MTQTIEAIYEDNVLKPLTRPEGLQEHQCIKITFTTNQSKKSLVNLIGTLTKEEAHEMQVMIDNEFERIENEW